jgi:large subunit ribosomal protein L25
MEQKTLNVEVRDKLRKSEMKKLRASGRIPAVVYGNSEPVAISFSEREFSKEFHAINEHTIITLNAGKKSYDCLVKDFQDDILTGKLQHMDFYEIKKGKLLKTNIPVHTAGTAPGVREGGLLEIALHELEVECLPKDIPSEILVDVGSLSLGDSIHVSEITAPEGVKFLSNPEQVVVQVSHTSKAEAPVVDEEAEGTTPEVIGESTEDEE